MKFKLVLLILLSFALYANEPSLDEQLRIASRNGDVESVRSLLSKGANPNAPDEGGEISLHNATAEVTPLLIEGGADVNADSRYGPPIRFADLKKLKILLASGADPNAGEGSALNARMGGEFGDRPESLEEIRELLNAGADPNIGSAGRTAAHDDFMFVGADAVELTRKKLELILPKINNLNRPDDNGYSILHYLQHPEFVELALNAGADPNVINKETGEGALHTSHSPAKMMLLLDAGANPDLEDKQGRKFTDRGLLQSLDPLVVEVMMRNVKNGNVRNKFIGRGDMFCQYLPGYPIQVSVRRCDNKKICTAKVSCSFGIAEDITTSNTYDAFCSAPNNECPQDAMHCVGDPTVTKAEDKKEEAAPASRVSPKSSSSKGVR